MEKFKIILGIGALLLIVGVVASGSVGAGYVVGGGGRVSESKWLYECNGEVDSPFSNTVLVHLADFIGEAEFTEDSVQCVKKECGFIDRLGFLDLGTERKGQIQVTVDGVVRASEDWRSTFGRDTKFQLTTECVEQGSIDVILYDDEGGLIDQVEDV